MAHSGDGTGWSTTTPANSEPVYKGALELRDSRLGVELRIKKEHVLPAASSVGMEHKHGSAKAYSQSGAPTKSPDGSTSDGEGANVFTSADIGRLWHDTDTNTFQVLVDETGPEWVQVGTKTGTVMWFYANAAPAFWTIVPGIGDELLAVKGGSTYTTGAAVAGTWSHAHSGSSGAVTLTSAQSGVPAHAHNVRGAWVNNGSAGAEGVLTNTAAYTIATAANTTANAASSHAHTVAAETAYRPDARVGILCTKD